MGGTDEMSNLVTLCDGCHASHHPNLAGGLARRVLERWAVRLARWLDRSGSLVEASGNFGPALRLFGVQRFRTGQLPIVLAALSGKSVLVVSPTGSGKTLCFQLPAVLRQGVSLVVCPLKTLMSEQVSDLLKRKIPAAFINSDLNAEEKDTRFSLLSRQAFKLLYVAPERFFVRSESERAQLKQSRPSFLVVDEAHCVDQWGHDFRPEYGRLREVREKLGSPPVLAFTATAGSEMQQRILASLGIPDAKVFVRDVDRPNIGMLRWECAPDDRAREIAGLLGLPQLSGQKAMVFVPSVGVGEELQQALRAAGLDVRLYHSRLGTPWERQELVKRFLGQTLPVVDHIICTNAFGMGLDVPNVRLVVHWQQSASTEGMLQELGRAGRDGKPSLSVIFHDGRTGKDTSRLKFMAERTIEGSRLDEAGRAKMLEQHIRQIDQVSAMLRSRSCFRRLVLAYFSGVAAPNHRLFSEWLLEWVFGAKTPKASHATCCDACDAKTIAKSGRLAYAGWVIGKGSQSSP
jgi:ATP-dependent DNA helicase RecQ